MDNIVILISFCIGVIIALLIGKFIFKSSNVFIGVFGNIAIGAVALWGLDFLGYGIVINWISAGIIGLLGLPGVILLVVLKYIFKLI